MSGPNLMTPLAPPQEVDIDKIEQELESLWREAESADHPITRATAFNLVLVCDHGAEEDARELIPELALVHPTRTILVVLNESAPSAQRAWVTAHCRKLEGENRQICSEAIIVEIDGESSLRASSLIHSLSLGSLATAIVWHQSLPLDHALLKSLARSSERVITCATDDLAPASTLKQWLELYESVPQECVVTDLLWAELSGWRGAVAELFDQGSNIATLKEVRIHSSGDKMTCGALLCAAWIASTLEWKFQSVSLFGSHPVIACDGERNIVFYPEGGAVPPGIEFIFSNNECSSVKQAGNHFSLTCGDVKRVAPLRQADTLALLTHELHAWGRDPRMDKSVRMAHDWLPELLFS
ncbi:MAG: glucose-6-phosphate dehydrogenase assembly protein OpcA [bacterium]|nr:glucose-6-phosphate dehydrogenase assembly protein OpcA [bacterium]